MIPASFSYTRNMKNSIRDETEFIVEIQKSNIDAQESASVSASSFVATASAPETFFDDSLDPEIRYALAETRLKLNDNLFFNAAGEKKFASGVVFATEGSNLKRLITITLPPKTYIDYVTLFFGELLPMYVEVVTGDNILLDGHDVTSARERFAVDRSVTVLKILVSEVNENYRFTKISGGILGKVLVFGNDNFSRLTYTSELDEISENLPDVSLTVDFIGDEGDYDVDNADNLFMGLEYGQVIRLIQRQYFDTGAVEEIILNNCLKLSNWNSMRNTATLTANGRVSQMDTYFTRARRGSHTLYDLAMDVYDEAGVLYKDRYVDPALRQIYADNPLPYVPCAEALQLIANLGLCAIRHGHDGMISLVRLSRDNPVYDIDFDMMLNIPYGVKNELIKDISVQMTRYTPKAEEELIISDTITIPGRTGSTVSLKTKSYFVQDTLYYTRYVVTYPWTVDGSPTHETAITDDYCHNVTVSYSDMPNSTTYNIIVQVYGRRYDTQAEYYKETFGRSGNSKQWNNPLVSTEAQARSIAQWIHDNIYGSVNYDIDYRGEPVIEAGDTITQENKYLSDMKTLVLKNSIDFNGGAISGTMTTRRGNA